MPKTGGSMRSFVKILCVIFGITLVVIGLLYDAANASTRHPQLPLLSWILIGVGMITIAWVISVNRKKQ